MESSFLTDLLLPLALAFIMLGMGMSLQVADFQRILVQPKSIGIGLVNQILLLPLIGFGLCMLFGLSGPLAVGIMILAACPGGATSNLIAHLCKGDSALSISLTAFSSMITIITIPFIVNFALVYFGQESATVQLPVLRTILQVFLITLLPVFIGMQIRRKYADFAIQSERFVRIMSAVFLALIIMAAILKQKEEIVEFFVRSGPVALALNVLSMGIGFLSARLIGLEARQRITIAVESGIQNGTLGIMIATTLLKSPEMSIPPAIYSLIMFATAFGVIVASNRYLKRVG